MFSLCFVISLVAALISKDDAVLILTGLFAIASAIECHK